MWKLLSDLMSTARNCCWNCLLTEPLLCVLLSLNIAESQRENLHGCLILLPCSHGGAWDKIATLHTCMFTVGLRSILFACILTKKWSNQLRRNSPMWLVSCRNRPFKFWGQIDYQIGHESSHIFRLNFEYSRIEGFLVITGYLTTESAISIWK